MAAYGSRRPLSHARAAGGARRPRPAGLRALLGVHGAALRRPAGGPRWWSSRSATCAPGRSSSRCARWRRTPMGRCARSPRTRASSRAGRSRASATAAGGRRSSAACAPGASTTRSRSPSPTSCAASGTSVAWVTTVPSARLGDVCTRLARAPRRGARGRARSTLIARTEPRPPQREMANAVQQAANVRGAFAVTAPPPAGTGILLDDQRFSGWTLAMVGGQLRRAGAQAVLPVVLGTSF